DERQKGQVHEGESREGASEESCQAGKTQSRQAKDMIGMAEPRKDVTVRTWSQDATAAPRDWLLAIKRGLRGRCPNCGEGRIFRSFLKVSDSCPVCGEALHHHRADDLPAYL